MQSGKNILVVNDEKEMLHQIQRWLGMAGYGVKCTITAQDGVKLFRQNHFDLVLLDYNLTLEPMGPRTAKAYIPLFNKINPNIPIVIISACEFTLNKDELEVAAVFILHQASWKNLSSLIKEIITN